jgi:hypothetical protein
VVKKNGIATQAQDHFPNWICFLHQFVDHFAWDKLVDLHRALLGLYLEEWVLVDDLPIDRVVHELPRELDPLVDRRRGHPSGITA